MTTGRVFHQQINPIKGHIVIYNPSVGLDSHLNALRATLVSKHRESSGESRLSVLKNAPLIRPTLICGNEKERFYDPT
jgi:hypothetical protein